MGILLAFLVASSAACGGKTTVDPSGGGGGTTTSGSSSTSSTSTSTSSSGSSGCDATSDCPDGWVCIFDKGECAPGCDDLCEPCRAGEVCDECATGSCPMCEDCVAACVPAGDGQCDDHTDCATDEVCIYGMSECFPSCTSSACADPNVVCDECATGSCPCCYDCVAACMPY